MAVSPLIRPVNIFACLTSGTIFSSDDANGGSGSDLTFENIGAGSQVYAQRVGNTIQFRTLINGANVTITQEGSDITFAVEDLLFDSEDAIKRVVSGLQGVVLGKTTIKATLQELLYPTVPSLLALALDRIIFEYGDNNPLLASWTVTKTDETIVTIQVGAVSQTVTGNTQSGVQNVTKSGLVNITVILADTTATTTASTSITAIVSRKLRIGGTAKDGVVAPILDADINALTGIFATSIRVPEQIVIVPPAQYLAIELPTAFPGAPIFKVNGIVNNAFTRVRAASTFVNSFGYSDTVDVWVSNQISPGTITLEILGIGISNDPVITENTVVAAEYSETDSTFYTSTADGTTSFTLLDKDGNSMIGKDIVQVELEVKNLKPAQFSWDKTTAIMTLLGGLTIDNGQTAFVLYRQIIIP